MDFFDLALDTADPDARNTARHAGEELGAHRTAEAHRLKVKTATIGRDDRNPHLRHDLQKPLINRLTIPRHGGRKIHVEKPAFDPLCKAIRGKVGLTTVAPARSARQIMRSIHSADRTLSEQKVRNPLPVR